MFTNFSIDESILVSMKCVKSGTHTVQGLHGMSGILSIGNEIEWWLSSSKDAIIYQSCNNSQIDSLHLLDLLSSLLRKAQYAILKMMQALEARQCLEVSINAFLISYALLIHGMRWSLNMLLWSWWRASEVMQVNMSEWGRSAKNGW